MYIHVYYKLIGLLPCYCLSFNVLCIQGYGGAASTYIATQCPQDITVGDFWQMVWEQEVGVVVMLTGLVEGFRVSNGCIWFTSLHVNVKSALWLPYFLK